MKEDENRTKVHAQQIRGKKNQISLRESALNGKGPWHFVPPYSKEKEEGEKSAT